MNVCLSCNIWIHRCAPILFVAWLVCLCNTCCASIVSLFLRTSKKCCYRSTTVCVERFTSFSLQHEVLCISALDLWRAGQRALSFTFQPFCDMYWCCQRANVTKNCQFSKFVASCCLTIGEEHTNSLLLQHQNIYRYHLSDQVAFLSTKEL